MWPNGTNLMLFAESSCVACHNFWPVAALFFLAKVPFLAFSSIQKGVWPYRYAYEILFHIYEFMGLALFFFTTKSVFFGFYF